MQMSLQSRFRLIFTLILLGLLFSLGFSQSKPTRSKPIPDRSPKTPPSQEQKAIPPTVNIPVPAEEKIKPITNDRDDELDNAWNTFNPSDKLPANFKGHSYKALAQNLWDRRTQLKKDEFETTAQHKERSTALHKQPLIGRLGENDLYAFVENSPDIFRYDADKELMSINKPLEKFGGISLDDKKSINWSENPSARLERKVVGIDYYKGTNLYGVVRQVEKVEALRWTLLINNYRTLTGITVTESHTTNLQFSFAIKPEIARVVKPKLRLLYVCRLREPWIDVDYEIIKPTVDQPREFNLMGFNLPVEVIEVRCFNLETGEIYSKALPRSASEELALQENLAIEKILSELQKIPFSINAGSVRMSQDYLSLKYSVFSTVIQQIAFVKDEDFKSKVQAVLYEYSWLGSVWTSSNFEPLVGAWVMTKGSVKDYLISNYGMKPGGLAKIILLDQAVKIVLIQAISKLEIANQAGMARKKALESKDTTGVQK